MHRAIVALLLSACSAPVVTGLRIDDTSSARATVATPGPARDAAVEPALEVVVSPQAKDGVVRVRLTSREAIPGGFVLEQAEGVVVEAVTLRSAGGAVEAVVEREGARLAIASAASLAAPVELSYTVRPAPDAAVDPCALRVDADMARFCGERVLALPREDERLSLRLVLEADGSFHRAGASSLGLARDTTLVARPSDLSRAAYVFGNLTTAEFLGADGADHTASLGYVSFDPRWVAAEAASFRSSVDRFFDVRRSEEDPSVGLMIVVDTHPAEPISVVRRTRGALVSADVSAPWSPSARIRVAQLLTQRTMGGALWIGRRTPEEEARGLWFSEGLSRAAAVFVLRELGFLSAEDVARDANGLLAIEALSPLRGASLDDLVARANGADAKARDEATQLLAVRGALLGLAMGSDALRGTMRKLLTRARDERVDALPYEAFAEALGAVAGPEKARSFDGGLARGEAVLDPRALAPCHALVKRRVAEFELGIHLAKDEADASVVREVVAASNAERAGVRAGDVVASLDYVPGAPEVAVQGKLLRSGREVSVRFKPEGRTAQGLAFEPARDAPRACRE